MFLINTTPLGSHKLLGEYARFLILRYILTQFNRGSHKVQVIFDNPGCLQNSPKFFEQKRRDSIAKLASNHYCSELSSSTKIPGGKWREQFLNCQQCKRNLIKYLGKNFLDNIGPDLQPQQTLYVAGAFDGGITNTTWFVKYNSSPEPEPPLSCNAEETDTRVWLHVTHTSFKKILVVSPDTDVYHIGLPLQCVKEKDILVQVSPISSRSLQLVNVSELVHALCHDPDLARVNPNTIPEILQTMCAVSGCDYVSFFSEVGKATFLKYFYQYATFITGSKHSTTGTLADTSLDNNENNNGFLSFLCLIGTIYF